ncbi:Zn finger protein [Blastocladiella emersonii ATCC 22665]|nr:Zn finger protein [Blastocladiella emersonii ATCC 22665]
MDVYSLLRKKRPANPTLAPRDPNSPTASPTLAPSAATTTTDSPDMNGPGPGDLGTLKLPSMLGTLPPSNDDASGTTTPVAAAADGTGPIARRLMRSISQTFLLRQGAAGAGGANGSGDVNPNAPTAHGVGAATPPPPRTHWRPDSDVAHCVDCGVTFTLLERRHHCRKCGDIFCNACTPTQARVDESLQFSDHGHLVRVCKSCARAADRDRADPLALRREVERLREHKLMLERERAAKEAELAAQFAARAASVGAAPTAAVAIAAGTRTPGGPGAAADPGKDGIGTLGSVPSDWNWSTF